LNEPRRLDDDDGAQLDQILLEIIKLIIVKKSTRLDFEIWPIM